MAQATTNDRPVSPDSETTVIKAIKEAKHEADLAKNTRARLNRRNRQAYMGIQDWTHKQTGQSREFLPKTAVAIEQLSAFIKRSLVQFGDWFSVDVPPDSPFKPHEIVKLMTCFLDNLADGMRKKTTFPLQLADAVKMALMESLLTFKVHGFHVPERAFFAERGTKVLEENGQTFTVATTKLKDKIRRPWHLAIDIVRADDYYPDPTGRNLYEIHTVERDLHDVIELANQGLYTKSVVDQIEGDFADRHKEYQDQITRNQQGVVPPPFRKTVSIDEYWGDLLDDKGHVVKHNIVCSVANERYLIRPPEPNPWWHGKSPFVSFPIIRVPGTVWHKALFDHGSALNLALNELFNLTIDGGLAAAWGVKQIRTNWLQDPRQVSNGVPQGITLAVKDEMPAGEKVLEQVSTGSLDLGQAMGVYNLADREFNVAALSNDLKMGLLPTKDVKATEVVEIQQSQAVTLEGIAVDMEANLTDLLERVWMIILQNANNFDEANIVAAIGPKAALVLERMTPAERFAAFAAPCSFKVHGLSATLSRVKDFQKFAALQQLIMSNPILAESFIRKFSADKTLAHLMKSLNVNPDNLGMDSEEQEDLPNRVDRVAAVSQTLGIGNNGNIGAGDTTTQEGEVPAEVNQAGNPLSGMGGA